MPVKRLRVARIEEVVDGVKLRAQLTAAALGHIGQDEAQRTAARKLLHGALFRGRMIAKERLEAGAGGHETTWLLAQVADEVIAALYDFTTVHLHRARNPTQGERFAVVAVGGYGRGQLAPSSDIDLLFLRAYKPTPWVESVTESMLYMLWDMSLKVGHASRNIDECLRLAREDHTIQTALLEARHIAGDRALFEELQRRFQAEVVGPGRKGFVAAKLKERDVRHARAGASPYLVEPNVKEGEGGLRDLHTLYWIMRAKYGGTRIGDFIEFGLFTREEARACMRASDFLWRVRCFLHFLTGRAEERLTFDVQPEIASRMGYRDRADRPAVERFMRRYFLAARTVTTASRIMAAKIEEETVRNGLSLPGFRPRQHSLAPGFVAENGRVSVVDPRAFDDEPAMLLRAFQVADARGLEIAPATFAAIVRHAGRIGPKLRADPAAIEAFLSVASSLNDPAGALRLMNQAGVLGRFLPEFGGVVCQMQFNMYHHYTVDEHTLRAIQAISDIEHGRFAKEHPLATSIFPKILNRRALYLAMLLHDTGKGHGDQQIEGEKSARTACQRLGLPEEEVELVAWLVRHHLVMSDVAQKRDVGDPRTVASFAQIVGTLERLRLLLVLTVADIRAVGPGVWNGWKGQLMRDLYRLTEAVFHGGRTDEAAVRARLAAQAQDARRALEQALGPFRGMEARAFLDTLDDAYWVSFSQGDQLWHVEEALVARGREGAHVAARPSPSKGVTEMLVLAPDRPGLFARLAAAFAVLGADVRDARVTTTKDGKAFDLFSVQDAQGLPFGAEDPGALERLLAGVRAAAVGEGAGPKPPRAAPRRRTAAFAIKPWVRIDQEASPEATVIELSGRDRPGLLAELSGVLARSGLSILSAHIDAYGERVSDVFYVQELSGDKVRDGARAGAVEAALTAALAEGEPDAPMTPAREVMATAPASEAR